MAANNRDNLRFIMGIKVKRFRQEKGLSLKELAGKTGLSISYLSEIEKGKKYPKPEKIMTLAGALGIKFDDLVSLQVNKALDPLSTAVSSPFIQEFPFKMYGVSAQDLLGLFTDDPERAGALIRTFLEIGQAYDMRVEHLLFAALRSYQQMHRNYFEEIEMEVDAFREKHGLSAEGEELDLRLRELLEKEYGYTIDEESLPRYAELQHFRAVCVGDAAQRLLINPALLNCQKAFEFGRELGYNVLGLSERIQSASLMRVESFDQLIHNFKASYFAGALLMNRATMVNELRAFFGMDKWRGQEFFSIIARLDVTAEMFMHRVSEVLPRFFDLNDLLFYRFHKNSADNKYDLTKQFNMSNFFLPNGISSHEHYCRRWLALKLIKQVEADQAAGQYQPLIAAQRSRFIDLEQELFTISMAGAVEGSDSLNMSGSISFLVNKHFKKTVNFWDDPSIPIVQVNETCERCGLSEDMCSDRGAPPLIFEKSRQQKIRENVFQQLLDEMKG